MKFSFIIPTKNEEKYISGCLSSIRNQTVKDHETIIVDSYSADRTVQISRKFTNKILFEKRKGPAVARNRGTEMARGEILIFTDADVNFSSDFLEKLGRRFRGISGCVFKIIPYDAGCFSSAFIYDALNMIMRLIFKVGFVMTPGSCSVFDKKIFNKTGGFDEKLLTNEDHDIARRASKFKEFKYFEDIIVYTSARRVNKIGLTGAFILYFKSVLIYFINKRCLRDYWNN